MENFIHKFYYLFVLVISVLRKSTSSSSLEDVFTKDGDIVIGALFPFYQRDSNGDCTVVSNDALFWVKALNFALGELKSSKNPWIKNVTFGLHLRDTCSKPALEHSLDFLHLNKQASSLKKSSSKVFAVLTNANDVDSSTLLSLFRIPQIVFSDHLPSTFPSSHPYSFESIKTSYYRAKSLVGLIKYFQWKSVSLVGNQLYSKEYLMFKHFAEMEGICLAAMLETAKLDVQEKNMVDRLGHGLGVRVVILFTGEKDTLNVIQGVGARRPSHYVWIDALGTAESITQDLSRITETVLTLTPEYQFLEELRNHVMQSDCKKQTPKKTAKDFADMLVDRCDMEVSSQRILEETLKAFATKRNQDMTKTRVAHRRAIEVQGIVNGVFAVGHAVARHVEVEAKCWDKTKDECFETFSSHHLARELQILIQDPFGGDGSREKYCLKANLFSLVSFNGNTSGPPSGVVGTWDNKNWYINRAGISWPGKLSSTPDSTCGPACPLGHIRVTEKRRKCCWSCRPCNYNQYITNSSTCADCVRGYWPSKDFRSCEFKLHLTLVSCTVAISSVAGVLYSLVL